MDIKEHPIYEELVQREFSAAECLVALKNPDKAVYWSWGVEKVVNYNGKGIILLVSARLHVGVVFVRLSWDDTYSYYLLNPDLSIKKEEHNVYCDELQFKIDQDIEYVKSYKQI